MVKFLHSLETWDIPFSGGPTLPAFPSQRELGDGIPSLCWWQGQGTSLFPTTVPIALPQ